MAFWTGKHMAQTKNDALRAVQGHRGREARRMSKEELERELTKARLQVVAMSKGLRWLADKLACMGERPLIDGKPICEIHDQCTDSGCAGCWGAASLYATLGDGELGILMPTADAPKVNAKTIKAGFKANARTRTRKAMQ